MRSTLKTATTVWLLLSILLLRPPATAFLLSANYGRGRPTRIEKRLRNSMLPLRRAQQPSSTNSNEDTPLAATIPTTQQQPQELRDALFDLLDTTPANAPTSRDLTSSLLSVVRNLEDNCPTPDDQVVAALGGTWELLWTTQDRSSDQFNTMAPFRTWINPLENQSYSNNPNGPEGRLNPVLPRPVQDQLERMGIIKVDEELSNVKSMQNIDLQRGRVRNVVTFAIPSLLPESAGSPRRASLTVDIDLTPDPTSLRRINVKFQACRIVVPKSPIDVTLPLGVLGPTGWLQTNYIDDKIRITRGHKGSVFVLKRPSATTSSS